MVITKNVGWILVKSTVNSQSQTIKGSFTLSESEKDQRKTTIVKGNFRFRLMWMDVNRGYSITGHRTHFTSITTDFSLLKCSFNWNKFNYIGPGLIFFVLFILIYFYHLSEFAKFRVQNSWRLWLRTWNNLLHIWNFEKPSLM